MVGLSSSQIMRVIKENKIEKLVRKLGKIRAGTDIDIGVELTELLEDSSEWQPINTAPDDERILIYYPAFGMSVIGVVKEGVFTLELPLDDIPRSIPTHWQTLPKRPK
jgi:hypothetical protein